MTLFMLATLVPRVKAWDQADFEIFDLVDELEKSEGKGVTFYSWLDIPATATAPEIGKAYRKLSLRLHPDKNKQDVKAKERFARLGKVAGILRNSASRERYNFFYKNGVPRWRGTGYYYARFRPGLTTVIVFLAFLVAGMQYLASWINYYLEKRRILNFVEDARLAMALRAPKGHGAPTIGRSVLEIQQNMVRCEVISDEYLIVYPEQADPIHLNVEWVEKPDFKEVYLVRWPKSIYEKFTMPKEKVEEEEEEEEEEKSDQKDAEVSSTALPKKKAKKREIGNVEGTKVGGRRRAVRK
ncbi:DnaJ domain-containing protein [Phycomyces nitens]|nr:DnaJ domain-containing protein [Phycomyces nitens]